MDFKNRGRSLKITTIRKRNAMVGAGLFLAFGIQIYFTILSPMIDPTPYKEIREKARLHTLSNRPTQD